MLKTIFSKENIFVLFLFAGYFKESLPFPVDGTLLFFVLSVVIALFHVLSKGEIAKSSLYGISVFSPIFIYVIISYLYSTSDIYAMDKTLRFALLTSWSFIGALLIIDNKESLMRFFKSIIVFSLIMSGVAFFSYLNSDGGFGFLTVLGSNYQHLGRAAGIGSILMIALYLYDTEVAIKHKMIALIFIAVSSFILAINGARMPLIAFCLVTILLFLISFKIKKGVLYINKGIRPLVVLSIILLAFGFFAYSAGALDTTLNRFTVLVEQDNGGESANGRLQRYDSALEMVANKPIFGYGIGSFPVFHDGVDSPNYPHNIFLEFLSEFGIIGSLLFVTLILIGLIKVIKLEKSVIKFAVILGFAYVFLNANISGDINDNKLLFTFLAIMFILPRIINSQTTNETSAI